MTKGKSLMKADEKAGKRHEEAHKDLLANDSLDKRLGFMQLQGTRTSATVATPLEMLDAKFEVPSIYHVI